MGPLKSKRVKATRPDIINIGKRETIDIKRYKNSQKLDKNGFEYM